MRNRVILLLGAVQAGVGLFIALRPVAGTGAPLTGSRALDLAFAAFFLIRGVMNVRAVRRAAREARLPDTAPPSPPIP